MEFIMATTKKPATTKATPKTTTTRTRKTVAKTVKTPPKESSINISKVDNGYILDYYDGKTTTTSIFEDKSSDKMVTFITDQLSKFY
jgi:hypothetical protein